MIFKARPWQKPMMKHVLDVRRANLWADMGSGKTSSILTSLAILNMAGSNFFPALVLAPLRVARDVWPKEVNQWDHLSGMKMSPIIGPAPDRIRALNRKADVYAINYENIPWLVERYAGNWPFRTVIADESTRLKGFRMRQGTMRSTALSHVAHKTDRWVNLTGTPAPNGLKDLWGQTWFLDFGQRLGQTYTSFMNRWFDRNEYSREITAKEGAEKEIHDRLKDITLTIQMKDWLDLREPVRSNIYVELPSKARAQYKELEDQMYLQLEKDIEVTALTAAARTTKCLQFASGAVYYEESRYAEIHDAKLEALESIIEETNGANLLVFYWWKHDLERLQKRFKHLRVLRNSKDENDWNAGKISLMAAHPQSAGHGLNLQRGGHHIVWFSLWWGFETYAQANERLGPVRQMQAGFDRSVYQYHILTRDTMDDLVMENLETKASVQDLLLNAMKQRRK